MFFAAFLYALLATTVLAAPRGNLESRIARRRGGLRQKPSLTYNTTHAESSWAGAVLHLNAGTYKSATGSALTFVSTFVVPTPKVPSGKSSSGFYAASAWVGIDDGDTCGTAILQTGIDFTIDNGDVSFDAYSTTSGIVSLENLSTGVTVSKQLSSTTALCLQDPEWIVEQQGGQLVPVPDFGNVTFTNAQQAETNATSVTVGHV
ncbi:concanavalin A-like lectin/glucanase domain-containing protein [Roridomyces roridus]|uniref:Concanavalin A-like lectin/glucanase domain-containing protein n=1 Tax=Roridomyces roridus TaxID=1738132 RepID=A0AAD7B6R5_9AGAR|nr:concanavalin A-like lectin/glucanase domain-containing protein [Roridomyces roridus]